MCGTCGGGGGEEWARRTPISVLRVWLGGGLLTELERVLQRAAGESWVCSCHTLPPTTSPRTGRLRATTPLSAVRTQTRGSDVLLINSSGTVLGSPMVLKCLITNFHVTMRLKSPGGGGGWAQPATPCF